MTETEQLWFMVHSYGDRQAKFVRADGTIDGHPNSKTMDSRLKSVEINPEGLRKKHKLMSIFGGQTGGALMKGPLIKEITKESRAGLSDTQALTRTLIFDFDGVEFNDLHIPSKCNAGTVQLVAERVIKELPECFWNCSYIATASSSFGLKGKSNIHIEFWMDDLVAPRLLKEYLRWMNLRIPFFEEQLKLNGNGYGLSWLIDPCLAENARPVYIAHPDFEDESMNPFEDNKERIILIEKQHPTVDMKSELTLLSSVNLNKEKLRLTKSLLKAIGITYKEPKTRKINVNGAPRTVVTNPINQPMTMYADHGEYCSFNIGNGDSHAYLVSKERPAVVHNLKDEDNFLFKEKDLETYEWFINYISEKKEREDEKKPSTGQSTSLLQWEPFYFLERKSDQYFYGEYCKSINKLRKMEMTGKIEAIDNWYMEEGFHKPDIMPFMEYHFEPDNPVRLDIKGQFYNTFEPHEMLDNPPEIDEQFQSANVDNCKQLLKELCPTIYKVIRHAVNCPTETARFINWLAVILKLGKKTEASYLLHGRTGTGKGVIINKILTGLLTSNHVHPGSVDSLTGDKNDYIEKCLVLVMDEFKDANSREKEKIAAKLRHWTTESKIELHKKYKGAKPFKNYLNIIYTSNDVLAVEMKDDDRRINVCPRQELSLREVYPDWDSLYPNIDKELPQFAAFMKSFDCCVATARLPAETDARAAMIEQSKTSIEEFASAVNQGNLMYFGQVLTCIPANSQEHQDLSIAKNVLRMALADIGKNNPSKIYSREMQSFYRLLIGPNNHGAEKFGSFLKKATGTAPTNLRRNGAPPARGVKVSWRVNDTDRASLQKVLTNPYSSNDEYNPDEDRALPE